MGCSECYHSNYNDLHFVLLWIQWNQWLFLWCRTTLNPLMFRHLCKPDGSSWFMWFHYCQHLLDCFCFLYLHHLSNTEDPHRAGTPESLLHVCLPPDRCVLVLWYCFLHVCTAQCCLLHGAEQSGVYLLYYCHSHVEPPHIQPEEQRCQTSSDEKQTEILHLILWM